MILFCCNTCYDVIYPTKTWKWCKCKNIGGAYIFNNVHWVSKKNKNCHIIEVSNGVRMGIAKEGKVLLLDKSDNIITLDYFETIKKTKEQLKTELIQKRNEFKLKNKIKNKQV